MPLAPRTIGGRVMLVTAAALAIEVLASAALAAVIVTGRAEAGMVSLDAVATAVITAVVVSGVIAAILGLFLASAAARSVARPIERLAERVEGGTVSAAGWSPGDAPSDVARLALGMRGFATAAAERYAAAESERDRFATLLREMGDAVLVVAADDRIALANPAAERLLGSDAVSGRRIAEVARDHELLEAIEAARHGAGATAHIERDDPSRSVRVVSRRLPGGDVLVTAQDLTTVRRLETVRRDFVANVSHELRTPIASIKAMVETLESGAARDPAASRDFLARIHREVDDLSQLVTELLSLARIESGADALDRRGADPNELLRAVAERMRPLAERAGVEIAIAPSAGLPPVRLDREKIGTVLGNLVHNAVKFTPAGGSILLSAARTDERMTFTVRDTGSGLARDDLDRIFERFYKTDPSRSQEGTGLGLAIAKHIVLAHGGEIHAASDGPGRGSTFWFTLPLEDADQAAGPTCFRTSIG